jgi:hypothetical protein
MRKEIRKAVKRTARKGFKLFFITVLGSSVAFWAPWAVCHASAAEAVRFSTYLMMDSDGNIACDENGKYIQLFDEKGNLLIQNEDVVTFLEAHAGEDGSNELSAKEREFFLIDGKFYFDSGKEEEITNLSDVLPALFKYDGLAYGYSLQSDSGTVMISPIETDGDPVYVARVAGDNANLPAFTITGGGDVEYLSNGTIGEGDNSASFVYDKNHFYDEDMNILESLDGVIPESTEDGPMFTGYYAKNGEDRNQVVDIDGNIVMSAGDYSDMVEEGGQVSSEYCNVLTFSGNDADSLTVYSDMETGSLYKDYQRTEAFDNIGSAILSQLAYDAETNDERGHFAGYYKPNAEDPEAPMIQIIDADGNLIAENIGALSGNEEYGARFYHTLTMDGVEDGAEVYYSDGKWYKDTTLSEVAENISDIIGGIPADEENEVYSEEKEMAGVQTKYFIGYYFATNFGDEENTDEVNTDDQESEILLSDYDSENFDPANIEIDKIKFADRDGNIVFDNSVSIDGDVSIYQNFYTVTVWDNGEVETVEFAEEPQEEEEIIQEEEQTEETQEADGTEENSEGGENTDSEEGQNDSENSENNEGSEQENTSETENSEQQSQEEGGEQQSQEEGGEQQSQEESSQQEESNEQSQEEPQQEESGEQPQEEPQQEESNEQPQEEPQQEESNEQPQEEPQQEESSSDEEENNQIQENAAPAPAADDGINNEGPENKDDDDGSAGPVDIGVALPEENEDGE